MTPKMGFPAYLAVIATAVALTSAGPVTLSTTQLPAVINERCVHSCECLQRTAGKVDVKCQGLPLGEWPGVYPLSTTRLLLDGNPLQRIDADSLHGKGLENLETLKLSNCRLTSIDPKAFQDLMQLKSVDLSENNVTALTADFFKDLENFQFVNMTGNPSGECGKLRKDLSWATVHCGRMAGQPSTTTSQPPPRARTDGETSTSSEITERTSTPETQTTQPPESPNPDPNTQTSGSWAWWVAAAVVVFGVGAGAAAYLYVKKNCRLCFRRTAASKDSDDRNNNPTPEKTQTPTSEEDPMLSTPSGSNESV